MIGNAGPEEDRGTEQNLNTITFTIYPTIFTLHHVLFVTQVSYFEFALRDHDLSKKIITTIMTIK